MGNPKVPHPEMPAWLPPAFTGSCRESQTGTRYVATAVPFISPSISTVPLLTTLESVEEITGVSAYQP
jgi:hypothetical protein